jgi:hypothetical protein
MAGRTLSLVGQAKRTIRKLGSEGATTNAADELELRRQDLQLESHMIELSRSIAAHPSSFVPTETGE